VHAQWHRDWRAASRRAAAALADHVRALCRAATTTADEPTGSGRRPEPPLRDSG
jgi:hypothetical protein